MSLPRRSIGAVLGVVACLAAAGCSLGNPALVTAQTRAKVMTFVISADYQTESGGDPEQLDIVVSDDITDAQIERLWCRVLLPTGAGPDKIHVWTGSEKAIEPPDCPPG
ncbi:MAG: hypothetical protein U0R79_11285 [Propionicimonas sp.]